MEPEGSLTHSQVPATCPYPEPDLTSQCPPTPLIEDPFLILSYHLRLGLPSVCGLILGGRNKRLEKVTKCGGLQFALIKYNRMRWESYVACMEKRRNTERILAVKSEGNGQLRRVRHRREYNIKTDNEYVRWEGADFLKAVLNHRVLWNMGNFLTIWGTVSFSRRPLLHEVSQLLSRYKGALQPVQLNRYWMFKLAQQLSCKQTQSGLMAEGNKQCFTLMLTLCCCIVIDFFLNNQPDALTIQIYSVIKLYMFRASSLPIIRSSLL